MLDGKTLAKALSTTPGPWMKEALDVVMAWQLRHPEKTDAEAAIEEVRNSKLHGELTADIVSHLLRLTIRPLFAKNQHPAVTAQGRRVTTHNLPRKIEYQRSDEEINPWKGRDAYALDLLHWTVTNLDESLVEANWPYLIPPILSITDDHETKHKAKGCDLITELLQVTTPALLARTGLGRVLEEAIMPCLSYLPSFTPVHESTTLLSKAFPALIALSKVTYPSVTPPGSRLTAQEQKDRKIAFLDSVVRKGVLSAYNHCPEHVEIVNVLLSNLVLLNNELGIESVKHLKYVLPMLTDILTNPFGTAHAPSLLSAAKAMQSVILNGWPRMPTHRGEVLKALTLCWLQIHDTTDEALAQVRDELRTTVAMLRIAVKADCDIDTDFAALIEADDRLEPLFRAS